MNAVRQFAEVLRRQFNFLKSVSELDGHYDDCRVEDLKQRTVGIGRDRGRGWTR